MRRIALVIGAVIALLSMTAPLVSANPPNVRACTTEQVGDPNTQEQMLVIGNDPNFGKKWDGVKATFDTQDLGLCTGTDPDNPDKSGDFVFLEISDPQNGVISEPFAVAAGSTVPGRAYKNYIAIGFYKCNWTGDSACGFSGLHAFASWGTVGNHNGNGSPCTTDNSVGIRDLGAITSNDIHDFQLSYESIGGASSQWYGYIDGVNKIALSEPPSWSGEDPGCWNDYGGTGDHSAYVTCRAWDKGDGWCGDPNDLWGAWNIRQREYNHSAWGIYRDPSLFSNHCYTGVCYLGTDGGTSSGVLWTDNQ